MKIVLASHNKGKIREIKEILKEHEIIGMNEAGFTGEIEETGTTFYDNALIKVKTVSDKLKLPVLADDSGLIVYSLNGEPGVYSARYAGENATDEKNNAKLLKNMSIFKDGDRDAEFRSVVVLLLPSGEVLSGEGTVKGRILEKEKGTNGFGYDPLFYCFELDKSFGEATEEEKNSVSHRYRAIMDLKDKI